ncbi:MGDG synthase family glycosyltransferase [Desulfitobacterium metallireducens]|uniref:UDP-N-acetylglucosamine:LPS N-acetylglucosamine transferase n=1 Tax=Desulfitobacterium metallireducens DSM 15288 TaxID=871968 RepID=W0E977_9FIRM|nr:glycosyltransferase [Desulfitobacterium metallireducens]AHF06083.1 UDP-N-acetylglucosamine:LPS N-acetylglucosamine transferase [Desulfitobacterium metallireducens DSM 15288]
MSSLRVLVISAKFGAGHVRAAEAVIDVIREKNPHAEIYHEDFGAYLNKVFNSVLKTAYIDMIKYTPKLWGKFYYKTSEIPPDSLFQRFLNGLGRRELLTYIHTLQPDLIVCTYPTISGVLAQLRKNQLLNIPLATVVTDYAIHNQWVHQGIDLYLVGSQEVYEGLVKRGIDPNCIKITGIPVSLKFESELNRKELVDKFGLNPKHPTILVMGGAYGVLNGASRICKMIAGSEIPVQLIIVCGKDKRLYNTIERAVRESKNKVLLFGFVRNVEELMTVSDVVITKAGGLTVSEALTKQLPLVIYKPIPGQEEENANFLKRIGAGKIATHEEELGQIMGALIENLDERETMRQAASCAIPGRAAEKAADYMLELIDDWNSTQKAG